ncbi:Protein-tyrosine sulfotransferase A [Caenorhabditis elegans]|uniref:Protein-tyrosine sulfotransferase A n=1 Tax=Caenorhabditis elegans TaxID=6239 RepID=TPSTA_CAEEL|nr:Protein-tyrosine sulfotransferase A [Caenorhabditis elegans]O77081.1 RecName: Full=Protein-tyrosine sulfotransferase A; AltName: Full=Tyrosylprotein sulfotransferase A; Short=TPST-A [Caenorhabditis elegans]AAC36062.1 tyrosylprotein sulfotransferase-A [Caenorhabditis elegans]CAC35844.1 Protein-tyrosine sulfotransferase A [Caenorhabditis elegans]|eukprot:NP_499646.3 Protein-tyrosine sulfotransferase A [Caenorhabditis elegans]
MRKNRELLLVLFLVVFILFYFITARTADDPYYSNHREKFNGAAADDGDESLPFHQLTSVRSDDGYNRTSPFIFIGGVPRSGTTLMRAMLDAHPEVRCGEETRVIPRILNLRSQWKKSEKEWNRLQQAGVTGEVINNAISSFIMEIMVGHGDRAPRLCNKDPFTMKSAVYLKELFPNAKYLLMIRDGRATVNSIISRKVTITGFDLNDFRQCMTKWNAAIQIMVDQCESVGEKNCLKVYYEQLVLHPEAQMRRITEFLDIPWDDKVLHHEQLIGKDISLSNVERSSDQVVKPVNLDALIKWVGTIPEDVVADMDSVAPMLRRLGYDPNANPPNYGKPDELVAKKTEDVHKNGAEWYKKAVQVVNDPGRVDKPIVDNEVSKL